MSNGMPVPEWAKDGSKQLAEAHGGLNYGEGGGAKVRNLTSIQDFTSHFAEYEIKKDDVLVHLFPRRDGGDRWYPASYDNRGAYRPGRGEVKVEGCAFPANMQDIVKKAADSTWQGSVAIELVPELGAFVVQFQGAKNTATTLGGNKFVDKFCEEVDKQLDVG